MLRLIAAAAAVLTLTAAPAYAAQCRDAKQKFVKCADKVAADKKKLANGRCQWTTTTKTHKAGQFVAC